MADLVLVVDLKARIQLPLLQTSNGVAHALHRVGQGFGQANGKKQRCHQHQCCQRERFQHNGLLALDKGAAAQAHMHLAQIALLFVVTRCGRVQQKQVILQRDTFAQDVGNEHLHALALNVITLAKVQQRTPGTVVDLDVADMRHVERPFDQAFEGAQVAADDTVLGSRCQLIGNQLTGHLQLSVHIVQASSSEKGEAHHAHQQRRQRSDQDQATVDGAALQKIHGSCSSSAKRRARVASSGSGIPRERATWALLSTEK